MQTLLIAGVQQWLNSSGRFWSFEQGWGSHLVMVISPKSTQQSAMMRDCKVTRHVIWSVPQILRATRTIGNSNAVAGQAFGKNSKVARGSPRSCGGTMVARMTPSASYLPLQAGVAPGGQPPERPPGLRTQRLLQIRRTLYGNIPSDLRPPVQEHGAGNPFCWFSSYRSVS